MARKAQTAGRIDANIPAKKAAYLAALALGQTKREACGAAKICKATPSNWRKRDKAFAEREDGALLEGVSYLSQEATRRAVQGTEKPALHQGRQIFVIGDSGKLEPLVLREYSDSLLMFLMKSRDPETYCDRARTEKLMRRWRRRDAKDGADEGTAPAEDIVNMLVQLAAAKAKGATEDA